MFDWVFIGQQIFLLKIKPFFCKEYRRAKGKNLRNAWPGEKTLSHMRFLGETKLYFIPFPFSPYWSWKGFVFYCFKPLEYKLPVDRKFSQL